MYKVLREPDSLWIGNTGRLNGHIGIVSTEPRNGDDT